MNLLICYIFKSNSYIVSNKVNTKIINKNMCHLEFKTIIYYNNQVFLKYFLINIYIDISLKNIHNINKFLFMENTN